MGPNEHSKPLLCGQKPCHLNGKEEKERERLFQNPQCVLQVLGHMFSEEDCAFFANSFQVNHLLSSQGVSNNSADIMVKSNRYSPCRT